MIKKPDNGWTDGGEILSELLEEVLGELQASAFYDYYVKESGSKKYAIISTDNGSFWKSDGQQEATHVFVIEDGLMPKHFKLKDFTGIDLLFVRASVGKVEYENAILECMRKY